ncbi:hypothetical protein [Arthrobacter sp. ISL-65]|uniref:hypothetical protein n=1 Tax=Arthrobacter sp. ISL-65 TaxID=2819112 RepID=UPI001BED1992|nr:hypothetical protein [Arthrobacter sp. ISL-65]MBT2549673.1 hypothetical protein [Arthrobacter sp. ISL-65]
MDTTQTPTAQPTRHGYRRSVVADWRELTPGDNIVLLSPDQGGTPFAGAVDAISADGSLIWLLQGGCEGRRIFHRHDGYKTLIDPAPEPSA